mgnify:CR=1 FL=1
MLRRFFFFQAEDGIRDLVRSRGLGDVYKRQRRYLLPSIQRKFTWDMGQVCRLFDSVMQHYPVNSCLLYTSDAADERSSVDLGGRRIIKKKKRVDRQRSIRLYNSTEDDV